MFKRINLYIATLVFLVASIVYIFYPKISLSSDTLGDWLNTTSMPSTNNTGSHYSFIYNTKLYSIGGANMSTFPNGLYSNIALDGTVSNWTNISSQPNVLWHSGTTYNNYVYLLGGANSATVNINSVRVGVVDADGDINSWNDTTPLPAAIGLGASVTVGDKIYYAGGSTNSEEVSGARSEIYKADINTADGALSSWTSAGSLPQPMLGFGMIESNGYLIVMGGKTTGNVYLPDVKKAQIDPITGNIGSWSSLPSLPDPVYRAGVTKSGNLIVSAGGYHVTPSFTLMDKVNFAEVDINGDITSWTESGFNLPQPTCCFSLSSQNNFIYMIGGWIGSYINNVYVSEIEESSTPTPTPSPSPTASPSPSPTPTITPSPSSTPIIPIIDVPNLKQYSEPWQSNLYGNTLNTIKQWGCALTSASMVLQYHGHNIMPDALNDWLNGESDGYIRNSLINWLAISRYTKLHDTISSPSLEYKRLTATEGNLDTELTGNRPAILKETGHFVVGTGKLSTGIYSINDPGYTSRTDLTSYGNTYLAINSYTPTHSDLSYMMFIADSDIIFELFDSNGNSITTQNYIEDPIEDIDDPNNKSGGSLSVLLFEKPTSGSYRLKITGGQGDYSLDTYLYDIDGTVTQNTFSQSLDDTDIYNIDFILEGTDSNTIEIDKTNPTDPGLPTTNESNPTKETAITWSWTESSDTNGIESYDWRIPDFESGTVYTNSVVTNLTEGMWNFFVKAKDYAGNNSSESEGSITIDTTKPGGSWTFPTADSTVSGLVSLNFSATDNLSGVKSVVYEYKQNNDCQVPLFLDSSSFISV